MLSLPRPEPIHLDDSVSQLWAEVPVVFITVNPEQNFLEFWKLHEGFQAVFEEHPRVSVDSRHEHPWSILFGPVAVEQYQALQGREVACDVAECSLWDLDDVSRLLVVPIAAKAKLDIEVPNELHQRTRPA